MEDVQVVPDVTFDIPVEQPTSERVVSPITERELASISATAGADVDARMFSERTNEALNTLRTYSVKPLLQDVLLRHYDERIADSKKMVGAYAQARAQEDAQRALLETAALEDKRSAVVTAVPKVEGYQALMDRAIDNKVMGYADAYEQMVNDPNYNSRKRAAVDLMATRQMLGEAAAKAQADVKWWDWLTDFGKELVIPLWNRSNEAAAIGKATGDSTFTSMTKDEAIRNFSATLAAMEPDERAFVITQLRKELPNTERYATLMAQIASPNKSATELEFAFDALQTYDLTGLFRGVRAVLRGGAVVLGLAQASKTAAGKAAAEDLITKAGVSGLAQDELISKAMAAGRDPLKVGDPRLEGMSTAMQETIAKSVNDFYKSVNERLSTSGLTKDEVATELAKLRESLSPENNKAVAKVVFGDGDVAGQKSVVYWQDNTGRAFSTQEAAEAAMKERGIPGTVVRRESMLDAPLDTRVATVDERLDALSVERDKLSTGLISDDSPLLSLIRKVTATSLDTSLLTDGVAEALKHNRPDIAKLIVDRFKRYADNLETVPGVSKDNPKYAAIEADLKARKAQAIKDAEEAAKKLPKDYKEPRLPSEQRAFHGGSDWERAQREFVGTGEGWDSLGWGFYATKAKGFAESHAAKYGGDSPMVHTVEVPDQNKLMNWDKPINEQPLVAKAASKLLTTDELVALRETTRGEGSDLYHALTDKLGSKEAASAALDKEGVKGAFKDGVGKSQREIVVYNPDEVISLSRERVASRDLVKKHSTEELADDAAAEALLMETSEAEALKASIGFSNRQLKEALLKDEVTTTNKKLITAFDKGESLFANGKTTEVSSYLGDGVDKVLTSWKQLLGFDGHKLIVVTGNPYDMAKMRGYFPHLSSTIDQIEHSVAGSSRTANGMYYAINSKVSMIVMHTNSTYGANRLGWWQALAHELGHAFQFAVLRQQLRNGPFISELKAAMQKFTKDRNTVGSYAAGYRQWEWDDFARHVLGVDPLTGKQLGGVAADAYTVPRGTGKLDPSWYSQVDEFFAEQFGKWMLSAEKPVTAMDKFFSMVAKQLALLATKLKNHVFGGKNTLDEIVKPNEFVKDWLDQHVKDVASGKFIMQQATLMDARTVYSMSGEVSRVYPSIKVPGKPHIKLKSSPEEWFIREERNDPLTYGAIGKFSKEDVASMPWMAVDPKHAASELAVEARVIGVHAEAKVRADLIGMVKPFYDKLGVAEKARVKSVLEEGDAFSNLNGSVGKEFNYMELKAKGLNENEAAAYFATRQLRQSMYHLRNGEIVRHLRAQGKKEVVIGDQKLLGYPFATAAEATSKYVNQGVYSVTDGAMVYMRAEDIEHVYASGGRIIKLDHPATFGDKKYSVVTVFEKDAKIRDIYTALNYRPGEFARIYTDEYFIRMSRLENVDGVMQEVTETVRTAASAREAGEFTKAVTEALGVLKNNGPVAKVEALVGKYFDVDKFVADYRAGSYDGFKGMEFSYTRNRDEYLNGVVSNTQFEGRLFTDKRGDKLMSVDASRANTLDVFESMQAEITNLSRITNINEWRENMIRRWMNSFADFLPSRTGNDVADFYAAAGAHFTKGGKDALFAERTHNYIMRQIGVRTKEEQWYNAVTRRWTEAFLSGNQTVESVGASIRQQDWLGFLRSVNFNFNLGMFNPAQLIVQANGAATAVILSPIHGLKAAKTFPILRLALMSDNPTVWSKLATVENLTSLGLSSEKEFVDLVQAVRRTGILDNMKSTALHNLEDGKLNIFSSYPARVWGQQAFFFNRGEEFSRLVAFDVARREWQAANPGKLFNTREALSHIVVRMDDLTQNMTKANLARWQEGALSIPLQFAQYNIKLAANVMSAFMSQGRGFTKTEAVALLTGHLLFYGAAGNGLMWMLEDFMPAEVKDKMSVEQKTYLAQGLFAGLIYQVSEAFTGKGANVAVGSRLGAFDYYQRIAEAAFKDPANIYQALLGPTVSTAKRLGVVGDVAYLWWKDPNLSGKDVAYGLSKMTSEQVATLRNATKAYLFYQHQGKMVDSKGVPLGDLTPIEILGQALGFQPTLAVDIHNLIGSKKAHTEAIKDVAELIFKTQVSIMRALDRGDTAYAEEQRALLLALWPNNAGDAMEVERTIKDRLYPYSTEMQKLLGEYVMKGMRYEKPLTPTTEPKKGE